MKPGSSIAARAGSALIVAGLLLLVVGAKFMVIDRYGSDVPEWDQWDAEGLHILLPWQRGNLGAEDFFRAHNEHRIVLTKFLGLAGVALNGQWDSRLQCLVNAGLHALLATGLFVVFRRMLPGRWHAPLFVFLAATFGLPLAWQNVIAGFHSQQYFLLGFSVVALWLLPFKRPYSALWWIGLGAALLAFFSMGSGFLAAAAVLVVLTLQGLYRRESWRALAPTFAGAAILTALGWFTRVEVSYHDSLKAGTVGEFTAYLINNLRWPASGSDAFALLVWLPWLTLVGCFLAGVAQATTPAPMRLAAVGGWTLLQIIASAYARGAGGGEPASRYMDTLALGLVVNGTALAWLCAAFPLPRPAAWGRAALGLAWAGVVGLGLQELTRANVVNELEGWVGAYHREGEDRTRAYLATGRRSHLESDKIPYPGAGAYSERLDHAELRALLPASVRVPLPLTAATGSGFVTTDFSRLYRPPAASGLAPGTPEPVQGSVRGSFGAAGEARWESAPVAPSPHRWLVFGIAGALGSPGTSLQLLDAATRAPLGSVALAHPHENQGWIAATVASPERPFIIAAADTSAEEWFAFTEPVEQAALSRLAAQLVARGLAVAALGTLLALAGALVLRSSPRSTPFPTQTRAKQ